MEYVFGTVRIRGEEFESLKTKGPAHSDLEGIIVLQTKYPDSNITDKCKITERYNSDEDSEGNCYDWYIVTDHSCNIDRYSPVKEVVEESLDSVEAQAFYTAMMTDTLIEEE